MSRSAKQWLVSDELWERIKPLLPSRKVHPLGCHRARVDDRDAMNAIFFVLRTGCQWNALNATGLCTSSSAHRRFSEWRKAGVFERLFEEVLVGYDDKLGIDWRWLCCDGAMTKAPLGSKKQGETRPRAKPDRGRNPTEGETRPRAKPDRGRNPTDRGKLGTKRSSLSDARGVPLGFVVAGANRHDLPLLERTLEAIPARLEVRRQRLLRRAKAKEVTQSQNLCLDAGYHSEKAKTLASEFGLCPHIRSRGQQTSEKQQGKKPRRWVVEAQHSWLNRYRSILVRWSKKATNHLAFLQLDAANLTLKRLLR